MNLTIAFGGKSLPSSFAMNPISVVFPEHIFNLDIVDFMCDNDPGLWLLIRFMVSKYGLIDCNQ